MQDITEHLKTLNRASKNLILLESFLETSDDYLNESKIDLGGDTKMDDLYKEEPITIRKFYVGFMKGFLEKLGNKDAESYKDLGLWSASIKGLDWYVGVYLNNSKKAKEKLAPLYKALGKLNQGYNDIKIDAFNNAFNKVSPILKGQVLDLVEDPVLKNVIRNHEDSFSYFSLHIWGEEVGVGYSPLKKEDAKKIENALKPIKKLYTKYEVSRNGKRDFMIISFGDAKLYKKELKKAKASLEAMIIAKND